MQNALTVIAKIKPGQSAALEEYMTAIGNDIKKNPHIPFAKFTTTHFARWVMFDCQPDHTWGSLMFTACHDGDLDSYLASLTDLAGEAMQRIWGSCEGFTGDYQAKRTEFQNAFCGYMKDHSIAVSAFFSAYPEDTVERMHGYTKLRKYFETVLDRPDVEQFATLLPAIEITEIVPPRSTFAQLLSIILWPVKFVWNGFQRIIIDLLAALQPDERHKTNLVKSISDAGGLPLWIGLKVLTIGIQPIKDGQPSPLIDIPADLTERVDIIQNELTVICDITPGQAWRLKLTLNLIGTLLKVRKSDTLSNIATIHMARWVIFDNDTKLLFESNYDGTWESYIGDFVDKAATGLDAIWINCNEYPKQGAHNIQEFKRAIRDHECRAQIFYSAYADLSVKNLRKDRTISRGIKTVLGQPAVINWLRQF